MEGGGEKIVSFSYLVYVIIGLAIGPAIDKLVEYVDIVLSYQETLNSLKAKVEDLTTIISLLPSDDIEREGSSAESAVKKWVVKLRHLHGDASAKEQNIARINVVSRYRASKEMKQKISEMEKHLKLFPLIQLELILMCQRVGPQRLARMALRGDIAHKLANEFLKRAAKSILRRMKMVIYFNREVASLKHLVTSITPIVDEISGIPRLAVYPAIHRWCKKMSILLYISGIPRLDVYPPIDGWCKDMCELVKKAGEIKSLPWWNVIRRYKVSKDVANLISTIEAHVKAASVVSLEPLFQELSREKHRPSGSVISLEPVPQLKPRPKPRPSGSVSSLEPVSLFQEMIDLESQEMIDLESSTQQK